MANFTRNAIQASFLKLLDQRPLAQITVKDVVADCGVNRNTFYYYFQDIPELLEDIVKNDAERIIQEYPSVDSIEECLDAAIGFAMEHRRAVLHIYNSINRATYEQYLWRVSEYVVDRYIDSALAGRDIQESDRQIIIHYYTCTCFGVVSGWLENGMKDDLRQPFHRICELEKGFIEEILRRSMDA